MKAIVIKQSRIWKPDLTYKSLQALMSHFGSPPPLMFLNYVRQHCYASPTGLTGITWNNVRLSFGMGMAEVTMRARIPVELGREETFTKPYAILLMRPIHPELPYTQALKACTWQENTEELFKWWLDNCL